MNKNQIKNILNDLSFFENFTDEQIEKLVEKENNVLTYQPNDFIIRQGEIDFSIFILLTGKANVTRDEAPDEIISVLKPGDVFGELSLLGKRLRSSNVTANGKVTVFMMDGILIDSFNLETQLKFKDQFIKAFIKRNDEMNQAVIKLKRELKDVYKLVKEPIDRLDEKTNKSHQQALEAIDFMMRKINEILRSQ